LLAALAGACTENLIRVDDVTRVDGMIGLLCYVWAVLASSFKSKLRLEAENAVLRHQLIILRRRPPCLSRSSGPTLVRGIGPASLLLALEVTPIGRRIHGGTSSARRLIRPCP
jgi:hypothetical protein